MRTNTGIYGIAGPQEIVGHTFGMSFKVFGQPSGLPSGGPINLPFLLAGLISTMKSWAVDLLLSSKLAASVHGTSGL